MSAVLFMLVAPHFIADDLPPGWGRMSSPSEGFAVTHPIVFKRQKMTDKDPNGHDVRLTFFRFSKDDVTYIVGISEFDKEYMSQSNKQIFDNARNGSLARSGGKLIREKDIKLGKFEGREVVNAVGGKDGGVVIARIFVANGRQYSVMIAGKKQEDVESEDALRFLDSFKITAIRKPKDKAKQKPLD